MNEYNYTGNKTKNYFTAYLQKCIRWKRKNYLQKKEGISNIENSLENLKMEYTITIERMIEERYKNALLLKECNGEYPEWNELSDQKMIEAVLKLQEYERKIIYQHVFEERTFEEMSCLNNIPSQKVKGYYYYAIKKIRKMMGEK